MEFDENNELEEQNGEAVEIYSRKAVWWFSFFSPIIGGILLAINLYNVGYKRAIAGVVIFAIAFYAATDFIGLKLAGYYGLTSLNIDFRKVDEGTRENFLKFGMILIGLNIVGATVITRGFFKKYFPDDDYYPRSIAGPLIVTLVLLLFSFLGAGI